MLELLFIYLMRYSLQATSCYIATGTKGTQTAKSTINLQQQQQQQQHYSISHTSRPYLCRHNSHFV